MSWLKETVKSFASLMLLLAIIGALLLFFVLIIFFILREQLGTARTLPHSFRGRPVVLFKVIRGPLICCTFGVRAAQERDTQCAATKIKLSLMRSDMRSYCKD